MFSLFIDFKSSVCLPFSVYCVYSHFYLLYESKICRPGMVDIFPHRRFSVLGLSSLEFPVIKCGPAMYLDIE